MIPNTLLKPPHTNVVYYITHSLFFPVLLYFCKSTTQIGETTLNLLEMNDLFNILKSAAWQYRN